VSLAGSFVASRYYSRSSLAPGLFAQCAGGRSDITNFGGVDANTTGASLGRPKRCGCGVHSGAPVRWNHGFYRATSLGDWDACPCEFFQVAEATVAPVVLGFGVVSYDAVINGGTESLAGRRVRCTLPAKPT